MNKQFYELLKKNNKKEILDFLEKQEFDYYNAPNTVTELSINLGFTIPNYNSLLDILNVNDNESPLFSEQIAREGYPETLNSINIYKTFNSSLYFVRKEQFASFDEEAILSELVFTFNIDKVIERVRKELNENDIVKKSKNNKN